MQNSLWAKDKICKLFCFHDYHFHMWNIYYATNEIANNWKRQATTEQISSIIINVI
jgi:hypothetical protein